MIDYTATCVRINQFDTVLNKTATMYYIKLYLQAFGKIHYEYLMTFTYIYGVCIFFIVEELTL